ncbi:response regulator [Flaviaesturariibacter aridisoli]|uniref:Response regulator n=1 Tax=Flaviaesturariibacter aridisoli TaxID=2545761 RepID=A0A4R4E1N8_9BACT|nr:response regulator [Flaviaesturariibacter aridisoli]TCZ73346.1 response regulator [Flaviaesturariibacter aridisoli]
MKKILLIDDNPHIRENIAELLELSRYRVVTAGDGRSGIEAAIAEKPDLILCDILMPGIDGYGVLHLLQRRPELQQIPFVFLSAKSDQAEIRQGMSLGADDYITKPFDATDLLKTVESRLRKSELLRHSRTAGLDGVDELISVSAGDEVLQGFVRDRHLDRYKKKQRIFTEGNHPVRLYYVQKGKVKVYKTNEEGKELILKIANEGDFFGYISLLENTVYRENATALEDCEIAAIPRSEFEELMNANPQVTRRFISLLSKDVREKEEQLLKIAYNSLRRKVADALLSAQERFRVGGERQPIHLTRENLAAIAGTATESLIRTLTDFKTEGLIDIHDGSISILDYDKLERLVN